MRFKAYFYKKHGILLNESESAYLNYLYVKYNDYNKVLNEFSLNCTTRYFNKRNIKEIKSDILKEEIARDLKTPYGKGISGNIDNEQILADDGMYVEETANTISGEDEVYIEIEDGEKGKGISKEVEQGYADILRRNIINKKLNKEL
tara:strand:+ start:135 stop:575 length:441 start_codon:yes stop_codon:yes gene_type:complete